MREKTNRGQTSSLTNRNCIANIEKEEVANREAVTQVSDVIKLADQFDDANKETRHMILARLIDRALVDARYKIMVKFKIAYEQFLGVAA